MNSEPIFSTAAELIAAAKADGATVWEPLDVGRSVRLYRPSKASPVPGDMAVAVAFRTAERGPQPAYVRAAWLLWYGPGDSARPIAELTPEAFG